MRERRRVNEVNNHEVKIKGASNMKTTEAIVRRMIVLMFTCLAVCAGAQEYPSKPVKILVPFAPGGVADLTARLLAQKMSANMARQVVVENRPSAGGIVASEAVAKADPD